MKTGPDFSNTPIFHKQKLYNQCKLDKNRIVHVPEIDLNFNLNE